MAAQDQFDVVIKTTGDTSGAEAVKRSIAEVNAEAKAAPSAGGGSGLPGGLAPAALQEAEQAAQELGGSLGKAGELAGKLAGNLATGRNAAAGLSTELYAIPGLGEVAATALAFYETLRGINALAQTLGTLLGGFSFGDLLTGLDPAKLVEEANAADRLREQLEAIDKLSLSQLGSKLEESDHKLAELGRTYREALVQTDGLLEPIRGTNEKIRTSILQQVDAERLRNSELRQSQQLLEAEAILRDQASAELQRQADARKAEIEIQKESFRLDDQFRAAEAAGLSEQEKATARVEGIAKLKDQLAQLGVVATTAGKAFISALDPARPADQAHRIRALSLEWQKLGNEQSKASATARADLEKIKGQETDLILKLRELAAESAKPNQTALERLKLLEEELAILKKLRDAEVERNKAAAAANPAAAARIAGLNQQIKDIPTTGRPEEADQRGGLIAQRNQLARETGLAVNDTSTAVDATIKQTNDAITKLEGTIKAEGGKIPPGLDNVNVSLEQALKDFTSGLDKTKGSIDKGVPPVVTGIQTLDTTVGAGLEGIAKATANGAASVDRRFNKTQAEIDAIWRAIG